MAQIETTACSAEIHLYYCDADKQTRNLIADQLDQLCQEGVIDTWRDRNISTNATVSQAAERRDSSLTIALVLLSSEFVDSDGHLQDGIQAALRNARNSKLISILMGAVGSNHGDLSQIIDKAIVPQPLSATQDPDSVIDGVVLSIRKQCQDLSNVTDLLGSGMLPTIELPKKEAGPDKQQTRVRVSRKRPKHEEAIPDRIGNKFKVRRILGEGAFGRVYLAEDEQLQRLVAIKVPHRRRVSKPSDIKAYVREAQLVAQLDHPGIVQVLEVGTEDEFYVVSKFIEGKNLADQLRQSRPAFDYTAQTVATVAEALHYAHEHKIVHRDVKPANILIAKDGRPYVADFGLAIREEETTKQLSRAGTPAYMSPEQARGEGHNINGRTDVFSLGVIMYELLTGEHPFLAGKDQSVHELLERISKSHAWPPRQKDASIPNELERICLKAMANRQADRYTAAKDFADDLWFFLDTEASTVVQDSRLASSGDWLDPRNRQAGSTRSHSSSRRAGSTQPSSIGHSVGRRGTGSSRRVSSDHDEATRSTRRSGSRGTMASSASEHPPEVKIIPKGLRAFGNEDADFFLELLPGPRDRYHVPESIRFWQRKIEADRDTFRVGVIYGPSGCGKTSLVRAGLLPLLDEHVHHVVLEATSKRTPETLLQRLRRLCPNAPVDDNLAETVGWIRRGHGLAPKHKLLIVIDQFEQWLQACDESDGLLNALRQCNGDRVQCLLMVRDDFIMGIRRFMSDLEVPIQEGTNAAAVDLFDQPHARNVLKAFGVSYRLLPEDDSELSQDQNQFLDDAIDELTVENRIVPVHLALLTDMCKGRKWQRDTLQTLGGTRGIGEAFLQDMFETRLQYRVYEKPVRAVLKSMLPLPGSRIRDKVRSRTDLAKTAGYDIDSKEFVELVEILDSGTRLITPIESQSVEEPSSGEAQPTEQRYQLTHDYLVPSLRQWLTRKQQETARGRAELRLEELSLLWNDKPESRRLPGLMEWLQIQRHTRRVDWSPPERKMMKVANRRVYTRVAAVATLMIAALFGTLFQIQRSKEQRVLAEVEKLPTAITSEVPAIIAELRQSHRLATTLLRQAYPHYREREPGRLNTSLALLAVDDQNDPSAELVDDVYGRLKDGGPGVARGIQNSLNWEGLKSRQKILERVYSDFGPDTGNNLPLASLLAAFEPSKAWPAGMPKRLADQLVDQPADAMGGWKENLVPVQDRLRGPLSEIYLNRLRAEKHRLAAGDLLVAYAPTKDRVGFLAGLVPDSVDVEQFRRNVNELAKHPESAIAALNEELSELDDATKGTRGTEREAVGFKQMYAVAAIIRLGGEPDIWSRFKHSADPTLRSLLIGTWHPWVSGSRN